MANPIDVILDKQAIQKEAKRKKEMKKWRHELSLPRSRYYLYYFIFILCLAYIIDEIATVINLTVQANVIETFFNKDLSPYTLTMTLCSSITIFTFFFRVLADRYGRKPFLIINTIGMSLGMFICFLSFNSLPLYIIGVVIINFFIPCDIQVVYILETSKQNRRAFNLALSKAVGTLGICLIPLVRNLFSEKDAFQYIFLIPAIFGFIVGFVGLLFVKESEIFMKERLAYLKRQGRKKKIDPKKEKEKKKAKDAQGGLIAAIRYMLDNHTLLWLILVVGIFSLCSVGQTNYSIIMLSGTSPMTEAEVSKAIFIYPFIAALIIITNGLVSDKFGRKTASIFTGISTMFSIIFFVVGVKANWNAYLIGIFLGGFLGGYYSTIDTLSVMCSEESPTSLRSSILSIMGVAMSVGSFIATAILLMIDAIIENPDVGLIAVFTVAPALIVALLVLMSKLPETNGKSLESLDDDEFADPKKENGLQ